MLYLDLDELPELFDGVPGWSAKHPALAQFRRKDFLGDADIALADAVRQRVTSETGITPEGPIRMLANLRYFGYIMNPITCYYCFEDDGETLQFIVAEVNNTPWDERHSYVLTADGSNTLNTRFDKDFHVSPFHPMDMEYTWSSNTPGPQLALHMANMKHGRLVFDATLALQHQTATAKNLVSALAKHPFMTAKVGLAIYWQALRLWFKRLPIYTNPSTLINTKDSL